MPVEFQPTPAQTTPPEFKSGLFEINSTRKESQQVLLSNKYISCVLKCPEFVG